MKALLIIDVQNDFMPGGALAVPDGDAVIPVINQWIDQFSLVVATQDSHPLDHVSFAANHPKKKEGEFITAGGIQQILWPIHCVMNTQGAELAPLLKKEKIASIFYKGSDPWIDSYSAFFDNARLKKTGLEDYLKGKGVTELYIAGVATEYCVLYSVLDALELGFTVTVVTEGCRGINLHPEDGSLAFDLMEKKGARLLFDEAGSGLVASR